jgi:hypothetical protein
MLRKAFVLAALLSAGCASARTHDLIASDAVDARASAPSTHAPAEGLGGETSAPIATVPEPEALPSTLPAAVLQDEGLQGDRFTLKLGYYGSTEDELDDGYIGGVAWTHFLNKLFAIELELGYLDMEGEDQGTDIDVWALPIMLNGRLNLPIWILEGYAGAGIGAFYYDAEATGGFEDDGFLYGGNAFLGASLNLAEAIALGLEFKYYITDEIEDADAGLDAYALMLTLGWSR